MNTFILWLFLTGKMWIPYIANDLFMLYFKDFPRSYKTDHSKLKERKRNLGGIPVVGKMTSEDIETNFPRIKTAIQELVITGLMRMKRDPELCQLIIFKK